MSDNSAAMLIILQHSLGVDQYGRGEQHRNFFAVEEGKDDHAVCSEAVRQGLMICRPRGPLMGDTDLFHVTAAGRAYVAAHSPKPNRKQKALAA